MNISELQPSGMSLRKGEIHRLRHARGRRVEALSGCLWVTMDNDLRDVFVAPGRGFDIDADGDTLISALADACFMLLAPLAQPSSSAGY